MFQCVGERLNALIVFILRKLKRKQIDLIDLITFEFALTLSITLLASYVFMRFEGWNYFDSIYYCIITLTTIGDFIFLAIFYCIVVERKLKKNLFI